MLLADRGYDHDKYRRLVWAQGIKPVIARRGVPHGSGLGVDRWVVDRSIASFHGFQRLRVRWERRDDIHEAFLGLATYRHVQRLCQGPWSAIRSTVRHILGNDAVPSNLHRKPSVSSRTADIDFTFAHELTVCASIRALAATGWALEDPLSFMVNDDDLYDWRTTTRDHTLDVLAILDAPEHANHHVAVCIYHGKASTGGQLLLLPGRMTCSFIPTINRRQRLPDSVEFTYLSWYMHTLVPPLLTVGLKSYEACDVGH